MTDTRTECRRCQRPMIDRDQPDRPAGTVRLRGRDLCGGCYNWAYINNRLQDFPVESRRTKRVVVTTTQGRPHGRAKYVFEHCGCDTCLQANAAYNKRWKRNIAYGQSTMVDAEPARQHVLMLQASGIGARRIAEKASVGRKTIQILINGRHDRGTPPSKKIHRETAEKILAVQVTLDVFGGKANIPSTGGVRRLQALVAIGWPNKELAARLRVEDSNFTTLLDRPVWNAATARAVRKLYEELWNQQPPAVTANEQRAVTLARKRARENGWAPPMAWDDDTIDDPAAEPEGTELVEQRRGSKLPPAEELRWLLETDSKEIVAARFGATPASIDRALAREVAA